MDTCVSLPLFVALLDNDILTKTYHLMLLVEVSWLMSNSSHTLLMRFTALNGVRILRRGKLLALM